MEVVVPEEGEYQFESPIPIRVARRAETNRPDEAIAGDIEASVRESLRVRVDPTVVGESDIKPSEYKTDLITVEQP